MAQYAGVPPAFRNLTMKELQKLFGRVGFDVHVSIKPSRRATVLRERKKRRGRKAGPWANMTADERSAEMKKRRAKARQNAAAKAKE